MLEIIFQGLSFGEDGEEKFVVDGNILPFKNLIDRRTYLEAPSQDAIKHY